MIRLTEIASLATLALLPPAPAAADTEGIRASTILAQMRRPGDGGGPPPAGTPNAAPQQSAPQEGEAAEEGPEEKREGRRDRRRGPDRAETPPEPSPDQGRSETQPQTSTEVEEPRDGKRERRRRDRGDGEDPPPSQSAAPAEAPAAPPPTQEQAAPVEKGVRQPFGAQWNKGAPARRETTAAPPPSGDAGRRRAATDRNMDAIKKQRRQRTEEGGKRMVIEEPGNRVIVKEGGKTTIRHDETERLRRTARDVRREKRPDGTTLTIAVRPGGIEVYSVFDKDGRLERRYRRERDGREVNLIDNRRRSGQRRRGGADFVLDLRPPRIGIPRDRYIVEYDGASEEDIYDALMAPPVEDLEYGYTLDEVRYNRNLRDRMRRIDLDTVNFAFGSWEVAPSQYDKLARVARAINRILDRRPDEMILVEGHTDAVGSDIDNLTLSDRRAEEVAYILTETFEVPPENLVTQGYGEEFLKVDTLAAERANRRVAVRRITPLLARR
jgi:outer membrane protein OmpA-like peptidoglycan-associated protein